MRTKRKAESIFGAVLLGVGLLILISVLVTLLVPSRIPAEFRVTDEGESEMPGSSPPLLVDQNQGEIAEAPPLEPQNRSTNTADSGDKVAERRSLTPPIGQATELDSDNLPGTKQNEQLVEAFGQSTSQPEANMAAQPKRISIPAIGIDAPISAVGLSLPPAGQSEDEEQVLQWAVPNGYEVGWHQTSAPLRAPGNTVLNGHNNMYGAVFRNLVDLELGDRLILYDDTGSYEYEVTQRELFEEDGQSLKDRHWNARWMLPTSDERLTIISCWPFKSNSHRIVVIAHPVDEVGT